MRLPEIGKILQETREEKKISIEEVARKTKLPPSVIRKLEDSVELESLGKVYVKGFIKLYAAFLGKPDLVKNIDELLLKDSDKKDPRLKKSKQRQQKLKSPKITIPTIDLKSLKLNKKLILAIAIPLILIFIIMALPKKQASESTNLPRARKEASPTRVQTTSFGDKKVQPLVSILAKKDIFIQVWADGKLVSENTIIKGSNESWIANKELRIKINNPSYVTLEIGNQNIPTANSRKPTLYTITPQGFKAVK